MGGSTRNRERQGRGGGQGGGRAFHRVLWESLRDTQVNGGGRDVWRKTVPERGKRRCMGSGVGECLKSGSSRAASTGQAEGGEGQSRLRGQTGPGLGHCRVTEGPGGLWGTWVLLCGGENSRGQEGGCCRSADCWASAVSVRGTPKAEPGRFFRNQK